MKIIFLIFSKVPWKSYPELINSWKFSWLGRYYWGFPVIIFRTSIELFRNSFVKKIRNTSRINSRTNWKYFPNLFLENSEILTECIPGKILIFCPNSFLKKLWNLPRFILRKFGNSSRIHSCTNGKCFQNSFLENLEILSEFIRGKIFKFFPNLFQEILEIFSEFILGKFPLKCSRITINYFWAFRN